MRNASLRYRIVVALVIIVTLCSTLFAAGVLLLKQRMEAVIFGDMVREQFHVMVEWLDRGEHAETHLFREWQFYHGAEVDALPGAFRALPPGSHHSVRVDGRYYQVEMGSHGAEPALLTYDITDWENQEHELLRLLLLGVAGVTLIAVALGWQAARAILAPVRELSGRLASIRPGRSGERVAGGFRGSEIGEIAREVDGYLERMDSFVERERSFTSAASHELRTPLSVMLGAVDVLEANPQAPASQRAIARIRRACREMQAFIEATLFLAREDSRTVNTAGSADLAAIIESLLEDNRQRLAERGLRVDTRFAARPRLTHPASLLQIAVGNLLRNAIEHSRDGTILVDLDDERLVIEDEGEGVPPELLPLVFDGRVSGRPGGTGMGLNLVKRICQRFGWSISLENRPDRGARAILRFTVTTPSGSEIG